MLALLTRVAACAALLTLAAGLSPARADTPVDPVDPVPYVNSFRGPVGTYLECLTEENCAAGGQFNRWATMASFIPDLGDPAVPYRPASMAFPLVMTRDGTLGVPKQTLSFWSPPTVPGEPLGPIGTELLTNLGTRPGRFPADGWMHYVLSGDGLQYGMRGYIKLSVQDAPLPETRLRVQWARRGSIYLYNCAIPNDPPLESNLVKPDPNLFRGPDGVSVDFNLPMLTVGEVNDVPRDANGCAGVALGRMGPISTDVAIKYGRVSRLVPYIDFMQQPPWKLAGVKFQSMTTLSVRVNDRQVVSGLPVTSWTDIAAFAPGDPVGAGLAATGWAHVGPGNFSLAPQDATKGLFQQSIGYVDLKGLSRGAYVLRNAKLAPPGRPPTPLQLAQYTGPTVHLVDAATLWLEPNGRRYAQLWQYLQFVGTPQPLPG